jgi:hypothetical protein
MRFDNADVVNDKPAGEGLAKAVLKDPRGGLGRALGQSRFEFLGDGFEQGQNALLAFMESFP